MSQIDDTLDKFRLLYARNMAPSHADVLEAVKALEAGAKADDTLTWIYRNWPEFEQMVKDWHAIPAGTRP